MPDDSLSTGSPSRRIRPVIVVLAGLILLHLAYSWFLNPKGHLTYDSGTYHWAVKTLVETGDFAIPNGLPGDRGNAYRVGQLRFHDGAFYSQYPEFYTVTMVPAYILGGYSGLFVANSLFFLGVCLLLWQIACHVSRRPGFGITCALIYALATFAWNFSQSEYSHIVATFFVTASFLLALLSATPQRPRGRAFALAALSGLSFGWAVGVRYDSLFAGLGVFWLLAAAGPHRLGRLACWVLGGIPCAVALGLINHHKFGTWSPVSYGFTSPGPTLSVSSYVPVLAVVAVVAILALFHRRLASTRAQRLGWLAGGLVLLVLPVIGPALQALIVRTLHGAYQLAVDIRIRDMSIEEPALSRTPSGAMVYMDGVKKSLLQSMPFLALPLVALVFRWRRLSPVLVAAWLVPAAFLAFFGYFAWHGSIALNMRYFNSALPFLALVSAEAWQRVRPALGLSQQGRWSIALFLWFWLMLVFSPAYGLGVQEVLFLNLPLAIAIALALVEIARHVGWIAARNRLPAVLALGGMVWASAMVFARDYAHERILRAFHLGFSDAMAPLVRPHALLVTMFQDVAWPLLDRVDGLQVMDPRLDNADRVYEQIEHHLRTTGPVYFLVPEDNPYTENFQRQGRLRAHSFEAFTWPNVLYELTPKPPPATSP